MADEIKIKIPDIGGATDVDVIEILVKPGDEIKKDASLITLESDKASMEVPSPQAGKVSSIQVKLGDKVSEGDVILTLVGEQKLEEKPVQQVAVEKPAVVQQPQALEIEPEKKIPPPAAQVTTVKEGSAAIIAAGPGVRRMASELGVNLFEVKGTGRKSRITKEDLQLYVKTRLGEKRALNGYEFPSASVIDFSKFGEITVKPLNKIKRLTGINVHRSWNSIPHVTQFDEADITELEAFRKSEIDKAQQADYKLTILAFVTKVVAKALAVYPQFNASLDGTGENLIYKNYYHIGIAVETPNGLVVPVIKQVDQLSVSDIAREMSRLSAKARDKGLMPADMSGSCFTISSLGGIGGTSFTPIVNGPEVAILGLSRSGMKPVYKNGEFVPRLLLPLSLSYDHRVIDGAEAARFTKFIVEALSDIRRILL
jgi:pyruvate dehydrogenase E2 component (dihydrolipoamide acetyltransferase)